MGDICFEGLVAIFVLAGVPVVEEVVCYGVDHVDHPRPSPRWEHGVVEDGARVVNGGKRVEVALCASACCGIGACLLGCCVVDLVAELLCLAVRVGHLVVT